MSALTDRVINFSNPGSLPRADHDTPWVLVVRPGGIGDIFMVTSVLPGLKAQGYKIAFMSKGPRAEILRNNPYIDRLIILPEEWEPVDWKDFYKTQERLYDRVINFIFSIEHTLFFRPENMLYMWEPVALRAIANVSYLERMHTIAAVPPPYKPQFFPTEQEAEQAEVFVEGFRPRAVIGVVVSGSAADKYSPHLPEVVTKLIRDYGAQVIMFAEDAAKERELVQRVLNEVAKWADGKRILHSMARSLRWSLSVAQYCDIVIGPDTGIMWGVASNERVHKVVLLSHASPENITKHWANTTTLHADPELVGCWPCHKLHEDFSSCMEHKATQSASCMYSIKPDKILAAVGKALTE